MSFRSATLKLRFVTPGLKVSVPFVVVKSLAAVAVPLVATANCTVLVTLEPPRRHTVTVAVPAFSSALTSGVPKRNSTSFSVIVTTALVVAPSAALVGLDSTTLKVSPASIAESLMIGTVIVPFVTPAPKLTVPLVFV